MISNQERSACLRSLVRKQIDSRWTAAEFCEEHQLNRDRFYNWRHRFQNRESGKPSLGAFVELVPYEKKSSDGVHIRLGSGTRLRSGHPSGDPSNHLSRRQAMLALTAATQDLGPFCLRWKSQTTICSADPLDPSSIKSASYHR